MPRFSSRHKKREEVFRFESFHDGYTEEKEAVFLTRNQLSKCQNLRYVRDKTPEGRNVVTLKKRQGTTIITNTALAAAADVRACTYYISQSKYILATAAELYYLDGSSDPVEIGSSFLEGVPTFTEFNGKLIIHDSGITKFWDGTTSPVLGTNYGKIDKTFIDEVLATGDNSTTEFTGTLDNPPVYKGTLVITFTDTTTKTITADGVGRLTGNVSTDWVKTITGAADNGAGLVRLTSVAHGMADGDEINVQDIVGTVEANNDADNPTWTIVGKTADTVDLTGSTFAVAYVSGGTMSKNAISNYTTATYNFKCDGAPDTSTNVTATYDKTDGAPKSKAGLVRGSRLYTWGDGDNTSRLTYTEVNDEKATDTSSGGGYLDVDPDDGHTLLGALNFETSLLLLKQNSLHRIDRYPDDADFRAEKLTDDLGTVSHRTPLFEGDIVSFISRDGWVAMHPSQRYGDIQKGLPLSGNFRKTAARYANAVAYSAYNPIDQQLWLALSTDGGTSYLDYIYVSNLNAGGQISTYKFKFGHSCFAYVNGEMLIGGIDGHLYKLDSTESVFTDNAVAYTGDTFMQTAFTDWDLPHNNKHNKSIIVGISGNAGITANLKLYRNNNYTTFKTIALSLGSVWGLIYDIGPDLIINTTTEIIGTTTPELIHKYKFNYNSLMVRIGDIAGPLGAEIYNIDFKTAVIGGR